MSATTGTNEAAANAWLDEFFTVLFARLPVNATFTGVHRHDDRLPDLSEAGIRAWNADIARLQATAPAVPGPGAAPEALRHDLLLAQNHLRLQQIEFGLRQCQCGNPAHYTGEAIFSILGLFQRDAEPLADRVAAAAARMRAIPAFLATSRANIDAAPAAWTERAAREARAAAAYCQRGIPMLAAERGIAAPAFFDAAEIARDAFAVHAAWLESALAARPTDDVACGRAAFDAYLTLGHCLPPAQDASWLAAHAERALAEAQQRLEDEAATLQPGTSSRDQLAALADDHPTVADYYATYGRVWEDARQAAIAADLLTWPDYPIEFTPFPRSDREAAPSLYYLFYRCPPPFGRPETHRYLVTPIEPDMPPAEQERRLRATNQSVIKLNHVIHHAGLGHHVQNWRAFRAASRVGQIAGVDCANRIGLFCGGTLVEGWACTATALMEEIGFCSPLERLSEAQSDVRMAARAVVDANLHTGAMTLAEAIAFYERESGMSPGSATTEAVKNSMFPGAAAMYLLGVEAIRDLRHELAGRAGSDFSPRAFHDRFLRYGAIPVSLIAASMRAETFPPA
ncbi:MAG TPA: DUF885 family protein [Thermomicrobiales bacterium]|nr:DUF885 family protein [Thermomicrobiales bacterium]